MNRIKLWATFLVAMVTLGIYSCAKDDVKNEQNAQFTTENRSALLSVINGMLHFDTYSDFEAYIANLEALENDSNQVKTAYIQLGVDLMQEFLPNLTDFPVSLRKEQQLSGFTSARKAEETIINNALNSGDDSVFSIVSDPFFKSAINIDNSVHIGTRIFRFFDNGGAEIILNNNWTVYNSIKNTPFSTIISSSDIYVSNQNPTSWGDIYNFNSNGELSTEKELGLISGDTNVSESPLVCLIDSNAIRVTVLNNGQMRIELINGNWDTYTWTFSNNTQTLTGNPIIVPCVGFGRVFLSVYKRDGPVYYCQGSKAFKCDCGLRRARNGREVWTNAGGSGKMIRIDATIWVQDGNIGCRSRHFGRLFGTWMPLNWVHSSSGIFASIVGSFIREISPDNFVIVNQPFNETQHPGGNNASWENVIIQPGRNFVDPGNLSSGHRLRLRQGNNPLGTFFGFGVDRPRLILD